MKPLYTAKKSAWSEITFLRVLFSVLIIPLVVMILKIIAVKHESIEFYEDKIVHKRGWLTHREDEYVFAGLYSVSIKQGVWGTMFNYGDLKVDAVGRWGDLSLDHIKEPQKAKTFLSKHIVKKEAVRAYVTD